MNVMVTVLINIGLKYYHTIDLIDIVLIMKIGVYGLGRFGQFWARLLHDQGYDVAAFNRSSRPVDGDIHIAPLKEICRRDVLFLCTAISSIDDVAQQIAPLLSPHTLVADTCSVKLHPLRALSARLHPDQPVMGTHPMFGPDSAVDGIAGLPVVISPWRCADAVVESWSLRFESAGLKVIRMTADDHDREAARTQGITHFIGRFLSTLDLSPSDIGTVGFQKIFDVMEQTCNDPWQLFLDLQRFNPYTAGIRRQMAGSFEKIIHVFDSQDTE
jgi:prephenate dehydrogenase